MLAFAPVPKRDMKHIKLCDKFRGITWVDGKPKAVVLNKVIKCFSRHPRPDANVEILRVVVRYLIHLLEVDANSTVQSRNSGLESGASSMWDNWNIFLVANFTNLKKVLHFTSSLCILCLTAVLCEISVRCATHYSLAIFFLIGKESKAVFSSSSVKLRKSVISEYYQGELKGISLQGHFIPLTHVRCSQQTRPRLAWHLCPVLHLARAVIGQPQPKIRFALQSMVVKIGRLSRCHLCSVFSVE